ncbi:hypothetical protein [Streptomyces caniscabiei]|uniref:Uncharacterized protein n=1 Tax=Streptomyces caniscabiei TaxID=2746961 RepID=A0ABU4N3D8_9ACTN|nr:hypothetical protein [Streptomyces caniscabiei]MBE4739759.1 hypothetical protein [Streptomyces caniscabiei]MBE4762156.1 hypothetical protein [Streptomyces caniscabiei]MBE4775603.1 hypothetical protein [Streptomyces caniscabiei]MBE4782561.1 hypothetical protein [Streptomyces caniscabiei]MBE4791864.1 hypothetical protein [Streptomyces caniscabiei]
MPAALRGIAGSGRYAAGDELELHRWDVRVLAEGAAVTLGEVTVSQHPVARSSPPQPSRGST